jgi:hypothetical protein
MEGTLPGAVAAVAVLALLLGAFLLRPRAATGAFMPGDPASAKLRSNVFAIGRDLDTISRLASRLKLGPPRAFPPITLPPAAAQQEAEALLLAAQCWLRSLLSAVERLRATVSTIPPTYSNVLGLYEGLEGSDRALEITAQALQTIAARVDQLTPGAGGASALLRELGRAVRVLLRDVHALGAALDLE